jgi:hypothetical protein
VPVLTVHSIGDGLVSPAHESTYAKSVDAAGESALLRQVFVERAGHCAFSSAEVVAAFDALDERIRSGRWGTDALPQTLNKAAARLGNPEWKPAFVATGH